MTDFLYKNICLGTHFNCLNKSVKAYLVGTHFELPQLDEAIQMSTNNIKKQMNKHGCHEKTTKCLTVCL